MFTGLVQMIGTLRQCRSGLQVIWDGQHGSEGLSDAALGDSIAVDGVCLTVAERLPQGFRADVSAETLARTTLGAKAAQGGAVNLEPALRLADRLGGHLVSGHVDGLGRIEAIERQAEAWRLELSWCDPHYGRYICEKASIAVDGISLTVAGCSHGGSRFWIAVIPHTWGQTTLQQRRPGEQINLEADLLAKYAERLLQPEQSGLSDSWLRQHGWS